MKKPDETDAFRKPLESLVASARRLTSTDVKTRKVRGSGGASTTDWQADAWDMYDLVGEQRFLANNLAGRLSQASVYVGRQEPGGDSPTRLEGSEEGEDREGESLTSTEQAAVDLLAAIGGSAGGMQQILQRLAINLFVPGEGWIVGIPPEKLETPEPGSSQQSPDGLMLTQRIGDAEGAEGVDSSIAVSDLDWRMLSVSEVTRKSSEGTVVLELDEGVTREFDPDEIYLIRVWRPHPRYWHLADSPTRASLPVLRELVGLTMHVAAQVDSRLAGAGLLALPQSVQRALAEQAGEDPDKAGDRFTESLIEAMLTPISDRSSASAVVPLVVTVPDDAVEKIKHLTFSQPLDEAAQSMREEAIRRLALGQDAPPELLLGTGGMNHWGAWLSQQETVSTHLEPVLALICDALTTQYLWPALEQNGVSPEEAQEFVVWYDVDHLIARPNLSSDAMVLHERGVITDDTLRRVAGFDDTDAPEAVGEAEKQDPALALVLDMVRAAPTLAVNPGLPNLVKQVRAALSGEDDPEASAASSGDGEDPAMPGDPEGAEGAENGEEGRGEGGIPRTDGDPADPPGFEG